MKPGMIAFAFWARRPGTLGGEAVCAFDLLELEDRKRVWRLIEEVQQIHRLVKTRNWLRQ